jgi:hypothetical protein
MGETFISDSHSMMDNEGNNFNKKESVPYMVETQNMAKQNT